jgi:hypothetical protein
LPVARLGVGRRFGGSMDVGNHVPVRKIKFGLPSLLLQQLPRALRPHNERPKCIVRSYLILVGPRLIGEDRPKVRAKANRLIELNRSWQVMIPSVNRNNRLLLRKGL